MLARMVPLALSSSHRFRYSPTLMFSSSKMNPPSRSAMALVSFSRTSSRCLP